MAVVSVYASSGPHLMKILACQAIFFCTFKKCSLFPVINWVASKMFFDLYKEALGEGLVQAERSMNTFNARKQKEEPGVLAECIGKFSDIWRDAGMLTRMLRVVQPCNGLQRRTHIHWLWFTSLWYWKDVLNEDFLYNMSSIQIPVRSNTKQ